MVAQYNLERTKKLTQRRKDLMSAKARLITAAKRVYKRCFEDAYKKGNDITAQRHWTSPIYGIYGSFRGGYGSRLCESDGPHRLRVHKTHNAFSLPDILRGNLFYYDEGLSALSAGSKGFIRGFVPRKCIETDFTDGTPEQPLPLLPTEPIPFIEKVYNYERATGYWGYSLPRGVFDWHGGVRNKTVSVLFKGLWNDLPLDLKKVIVQLIRDA